MQKALKYGIRDEIEQIIKDTGIDRAGFHEFSKLRYADIVQKFYYSFCDTKNYSESSFSLSHRELHIRENIQKSLIACCFDCDGWADYLRRIETSLDTHEGLYLILSQGWIYEGAPEEIFSVLRETDGKLEDFFIVSKKFRLFAAHDDIEDSAFLYIK